MASRFGTSSGSSRFELPALNFNFGSLTDGTDIPPPPESPVQKVPTPPQTPPPPPKEPEKRPSQDDEKKSVASQESKPAPVNGNNLAGTKRPADQDVPLSPAASGRQGSLRRLLSRTMLNNSFAEVQLSPSVGSIATTTNTNGTRPMSQSGGSFMDERKAKRRSGWFQRLRSGDQQSKRSTILFEDTQSPARIPTAVSVSAPAPAPEPQPQPQAQPEVRKPSGPPPPMIPELNDAGSFGDDLFKNIK